MRRRITWRTAAAISVLGLAPGIGAAFAGPAGASTNACRAARSTQCGTFTESAYNNGGNSGGLGWDVKGQSSASDTPLIEWKNYSPGKDPATDLTKVEHYGSIPGSPSTKHAYWYSFVYTPSGKWTSMCVSNPDNKGKGGKDLVLRSCNGKKWQAFLNVDIPRRNLNLPLAPNWSNPSTSVKQIPNDGSSPYALYSMGNRKFVEGYGKGKALSATGSSGDTLSSTPGKFTNEWYWTNAAGK